MNDKLWKAIRKALLNDPRTQQQIAKAVGCSRPFVSEVKSGSKQPEKYAIAFCYALNISPFTGELLPEKKIRVHVKDGEEKSDMQTVAQTQLRLGSSAIMPTIPAEFDITGVEAEAVLLSRKKENKQLIMAAKMSNLHPAAIESILCIAARDYIRAIELISGVAQKRKKT